MKRFFREIRSTVFMIAALGLLSVPARAQFNAGTTWQTIIDDNFTRANTSLGTLGSPGTFNSPSTGAAWAEPFANASWQITSNTATFNAANTATNAPIYETYRPVAESTATERITVTTTALANTTNYQYLDIYLDSQEVASGGTNHSQIGVFINQTTVTLGYTATTAAASLLALSNVANTGETFNAATGEAYIWRIYRAPNANATDVDITVTCARTTAPNTIVKTWTANTVGIANTSIKSLGSIGMAYQGNAQPHYAIAGFKLEQPAPMSITPTPSVVTVSTTNSIALVGVNTNWVSGTTTFSVSGGTGASIASQSVTDTTHATISLVTGTAAGPLTISDGTNTGTVTASGTVTIPPQVSAIAFTSPGTANVTVDWSPGSAGATSYQVQRVLSGVTTTIYTGSAFTFTDTITVGTNPTYVVVPSNSAGSPAPTSKALQSRYKNKFSRQVPERN